MKRFITMIVSALAFLAAWAQQPMVTLSHDGELTFFTNLTAFESALEAAEDGDILYLSEGNFYLSKNPVYISKRVSVVGTGYGSHLLGGLLINLSNPEFDLNAPIFDGVQLEELDFNNKNTPLKTEIRRCWIRDLGNVGYSGYEVKIESCFITNGNFTGHSNTLIEVRNSKIQSATNFYMCNVVLNCNIGKAVFPKTLISSIMAEGSPNYTGGHRIVNSLLGDLPDPSYDVLTDDCYFLEGGTTLFDENLDCQIDLAEKGYLGTDGTIVGAYGGETPFSKNPSVPTVDQEKSSVEYDAENNKLKVTITVAEN